MIALLVKLDSGGPVFIRQERVGRHFRPFYMLKFRSMVVDAELRRNELLDRNEADGPIFKIRRDPRITRVGSLLRRSSLDELPQFLNVLRGEMSLVGPRPPFPGEVGLDHYRQSLRLRCTPGMTGIWQISGRSDVGYDAMVEMDLRYLRDASFITDLSILLRTIPAVVSGKGAW
jgi:lipopolysaccharide/colanic/teichoic acid biosynthesis glycosyltransferase